MTTITSPTLSKPATTSLTAKTNSPKGDKKAVSQPITKGETPSYKTYPFVMGTSGLVLGTLGGLIKTKLAPDVFTKTEPNGDTKRLAVKYSEQGKKPLIEATYDHYNSNCNEKARVFSEGSLRIDAYGDNYVASFPYYTRVPEKDLIKIYWEHAYSTSEGITRMRQSLNTPSSVFGWVESPLEATERVKGLENMTHKVQLELRKPIKLGGEHSKVQDTIHLFYAGQKPQTAKVRIKEGRFIDVALNANGEIHNAEEKALNGLPVWFEEVLPNMKKVLDNVPDHVKKLKKGLVKEEKAYGKNIFLGALAVGGLGYGLGWFFDWKKRHDRNKRIEKPSVEKASAKVNHTV